MDEYVVRQKRSRKMVSLVLVLIMLALSGLSVWQGMERVLAVLVVLGVIGGMVFGFRLIFLVKGLIKPKELLFLNDKGITNSSSASCPNFIGWDEIEKILVTDAAGRKMVSIQPIDVNKMLERLSPFKAQAIKGNIYLGLAPIQITLKTADKTIEDVFYQMLVRLEAYQGRK